jgi:hypothetical protein
MFGRKKPPARPPVNMPKQGTPLTGNQRAAAAKVPKSVPMGIGLAKAAGVKPGTTVNAPAYTGGSLFGRKSRLAPKPGTPLTGEKLEMQKKLAAESKPSPVPTLLKEEQRARQEKLANANAANNRQSPLSVNPLIKPASMSQLRAGANAIRGLPQGSKQTSTRIKPASMSQLRAGANAIRGLPQGSKQTSTRPGMSVTDAIKRASSSFNASNAPKKVASSIFKKAAGGKVSSASSRGDGCAVKGKTKGKMV